MVGSILSYSLARCISCVCFGFHFRAGKDERARLMRRTIMRYANLSLLLTLRMMCPTVKKRFPTLDHLMDAGFLLPNEKKIFEGLDEKTPHPKYWLPLVWATAIAKRARKEGKIPDDFALKTIIDEIVKFRGGCGGLLNFDWISIPLVYTQVVTLAVYSYFTATLMGNQYLDPSKGYPNHTIDLVIPIFTFLQFFFYMGWLLVAETLVNPFGEDDDDFEVNWLIDRNLQISYVIVDEMHEEHPELIKDQYWDQVFPSELPYTEAAKQYYMEPFLGSAFGVAVPERMQAFVMMSELIKDDHRETTPMFITGATHGRGDSLPSFQLMGSSLSLHKRKWKPFMKNAYSQPYSINSGYKFNEEDYPDGVFNMSGISVCSSRMRSSRYFNSDKDIFKKENKKITVTAEAEETQAAELSSADSSIAKSDGLSYMPQMSSGKTESSLNRKASHENESFQNLSDEKEEVLVHASQSTGLLRNRSADGSSYPVLPAINEHPKISLMDINLIGNATKLEILTDYKTFDCEIAPSPYFPNTESLLGHRSEAINIPNKSPKNSSEPLMSEGSDDPEKANFVEGNLQT